MQIETARCKLLAPIESQAAGDTAVSTLLVPKALPQPLALIPMVAGLSSSHPVTRPHQDLTLSSG